MVKEVENSKEQKARSSGRKCIHLFPYFPSRREHWTITWHCHTSTTPAWGKKDNLFFKKWNNDSFFLNSYKAIIAVHIFSLNTLLWRLLHISTQCWPVPSLTEQSPDILTLQETQLRLTTFPSSLQAQQQESLLLLLYLFSVTLPSSTPSIQLRRFEKCQDSVNLN